MSEDSVEINNIPSHRDFTDEEFYGIWHAPGELEANANRNKVEYYFERNWRFAVEEDRFIRCSDGKLHHPITVKLYIVVVVVVVLCCTCTLVLLGQARLNSPVASQASRHAHRYSYTEPWRTSSLPTQTVLL